MKKVEAGWSSSRINQFMATLRPATAPQLKGPAESKAFKRKGVVLAGQYRPRVAKTRVSEDGSRLQICPKDAKGFKLGNLRYIELPNSTAFSRGGKEFLITRGVRPYPTAVGLDGAQYPEGYISDALLFQRDRNGKFKFVRALLVSDLESKFFPPASS